MKDIIKLRDEAAQLLGSYNAHKDSADATLRRKVHLDLDRFLVEHREDAITMMLEALNSRIAVAHAGASKRRSVSSWLSATAPWLKDKEVPTDVGTTGNIKRNM